MEFDTKTIIEIFVLFAGIISSFGYMRYKVERLNEEDSKQWIIIDGFRSWKEAHDKDVADKRLELEKDLGYLRESILKIDGKLEGKLDQIFSELFQMNKKLERLENK